MFILKKFSQHNYHPTSDTQSTLNSDRSNENLQISIKDPFLNLTEGDFDLALQSATENIAEIQGSRSPNPEKLSKLFLEKAYIFQEKGCFMEALCAYHQAVSYAQKISKKLPSVLGQVYLCRGLMFVEVGRYMEAIQELNKALNVFHQRPEDYKTLIGIAKIRLAECHFQTLNFQKGLSLLSQGREIFYEMGCPEELTILEYAHAIYFQKIKEYSKSLEHFIKFVISDQDVYRKEVFHAYTHIAEIHKITGDLENYQTNLNKALELADALNSGKCHHELAKASLLRAEYFQFMKYPEDAIAASEQALRILKNHYPKDYIGKADCYRKIADMNKAAGQYNKALELLNMAEPILESNLGKAHHFVADLLLEKGKLLKLIGGHNNCLEAYQNIRRAKEIYKDWYGKNNMILGNIYFLLAQCSNELDNKSKMKSCFKKGVKILISNLALDIFSTLLLFPFKMLVQAVVMDDSFVVYLSDISSTIEEFKKSIKNDKKLLSMAKLCIEEAFSMKKDEKLYAVKKSFLSWVGKV